MSLISDPNSRPLTLAEVREILLAFPGVEEATSYGTPGFRAGGKLLARMHQDGEAVVVRVDQNQRQALMEADPVTYFITDHYLNYPWVLVRLETASPEELNDLVEAAWLRL